VVFALVRRVRAADLRPLVVDAAALVRLQMLARRVNQQIPSLVFGKDGRSIVQQEPAQEIKIRRTFVVLNRIRHPDEEEALLRILAGQTILGAIPYLAELGRADLEGVLAVLGSLLLVANFTVTAALSGWAAMSYFAIPTIYFKLAAIGSIVILTLINCLGLRVGALTQNVLTVLKMGSLAAIILLGLLLSGGSMANWAPLWPAGGVASVAVQIGPALVAVLWAYDGWIESTYVGSEIKRPERNLPLSIVLSVVIVTVQRVTATVDASALTLSVSVPPGVPARSSHVLADDTVSSNRMWPIVRSVSSATAVSVVRSMVVKSATPSASAATTAARWR
jgi:hypothetical protein